MYHLAKCFPQGRNLPAGLSSAFLNQYPATNSEVRTALPCLQAHCPSPCYQAICARGDHLLTINPIDRSGGQSASSSCSLERSCSVWMPSAGQCASWLDSPYPFLGCSSSSKASSSHRRRMLLGASLMASGTGM